MFAEDATRGFAFIDLCRIRYDIVLMNPPVPRTLASHLSPISTRPTATPRATFTKPSSSASKAGLYRPASSASLVLEPASSWARAKTGAPASSYASSGPSSSPTWAAAFSTQWSKSPPTSCEASPCRKLATSPLSLVHALEKVVRDRQDRFSLPKWQAARDGLKRHQAVAELEHLEAAGFIQRCPGGSIRYTPVWRAVKAVAAPRDPVFTPLVCIRALVENDKASIVAEAIRDPSNRRTFVCDPGHFSRVPGNTFAYWASARLVDAFTRLPALKEAGFEAWVGLQTNQDFLIGLPFLVREVSSKSSCSRQNRGVPRCWLPFAKGGEFSSMYCDSPLVVLWGADGRLIKEWKKDQLRQGLITENNSQCWNESRYRRLGVTWPSRTNGLSFRALPAGCIFAGIGSCLYFWHDEGSNRN